MIDPKYLDMLKKSSISERIDSFLNDTIDKLIIGAICDISNQPLPPELGFKEVHLGQNKLNHRKLIVGDMGESSVYVEFSSDFKRAYVANRLGSYQEVVLSSETVHAVEQLFRTVEDKIKSLSKVALKGDPIAESILEFISETRYGTNEYLCREYMEIYRKTVSRLTSDLPNEVRDTIEDAFNNLTVVDIREFLKDHDVDLDAADIHITDN